MDKAYRLTHLVSKLRIKVKEPRQFATPKGQFGRLIMMRKTVTALIRHERIELNYHRADEARGYAERIISDALRYGDRHKPTMDMAKFWVEDPVLVPKLFQVLVERFKDWPSGVPYTRLLRAPSNLTNRDNYLFYQRAVLELRGNPYPALPGPFVRPNPGSIHNVLLEEARKDYFKSQNRISNEAEMHSNALPDIDSASIDTSDVEADENTHSDVTSDAKAST